MSIRQARAEKLTSKRGFDARSVLLEDLILQNLFGAATKTDRGLLHSQLVEKTDQELLGMISEKNPSTVVLVMATEDLAKKFHVDEAARPTKEALLRMVEQLLRMAEGSAPVSLNSAFALYAEDAPRRAAFALLYSGLLGAPREKFSGRDADAVLSDAAAKLAKAESACPMNPAAAAAFVRNMQAGKLLRRTKKPSCADAVVAARRTMVQRLEPMRAAPVQSEAMRTEASLSVLTRAGVMYRLLVRADGDAFVPGASTYSDAERSLPAAVALTNVDVLKKLAAACGRLGAKWAFSVLAAFNSHFLYHRAEKGSPSEKSCELLLQTVKLLLENASDPYPPVEAADARSRAVHNVAGLCLLPQPRDAPAVERELQASLARESLEGLARRIQAALMELPLRDRLGFFNTRSALIFSQLLEGMPAAEMDLLHAGGMSTYGALVAALIFAQAPPASQPAAAEASSEAPPAVRKRKGETLESAAKMRRIAGPAPTLATGKKRKNEGPDDRAPGKWQRLNDFAPEVAPIKIYPQGFFRIRLAAVAGLAAITRYLPEIVAEGLDALTHDTVMSTFVGGSVAPTIGYASIAGLTLSMVIRFVREMFPGRSVREEDVQAVHAVLSDPAERAVFLDHLDPQRPPPGGRVGALLNRLRSNAPDVGIFHVIVGVILIAVSVQVTGPSFATADIMFLKLPLVVSYFGGLVGARGTTQTPSMPFTRTWRRMKRPAPGMAPEEAPPQEAPRQEAPAPPLAGAHFGSAAVAAPRYNFFNRLVTTVKGHGARLASYVPLPAGVFRFGAR